MAKEGPPHPPSFKKIRIGETSRPLKYSLICRVAASVTSTIFFLLRIKNRIITSLFVYLISGGKLIIPLVFVNPKITAISIEIDASIRMNPCPLSS
jgi:hypothetical protein